MLYVIRKFKGRYKCCHYLMTKELKTSYHQAEKGCSISKFENKIVFEEELRFEMLQYDLDYRIKELFIKRTIAPLLSDKSFNDIR